MEATRKFETVCITRHGFSILHTEGIDAAAKVTYHGWVPGEACSTRVVSEWLVPLAPSARRDIF